MYGQVNVVLLGCCKQIVWFSKSICLISI